MTYVSVYIPGHGLIEDDIDICKLCRQELGDCVCADRFPNVCLECNRDDCVCGELEDMYSCGYPGKNGCGNCDACCDYEDAHFYPRNQEW